MPLRLRAEILVICWALLAFQQILGRLPQGKGSERPNIVFFYIDDLGWTDLGYAGSTYYETPNIDRLAAASMVFTDAYANGPNCAPSRACLMSGQYTPRHGIFTVGDPARGNAPHRKLIPAANKTELADSIYTMAEALSEAGYVTASMGKWHLGPDPTTQGFAVNIAGREWGSPSGGGYHSPYQYPNLSNPDAGEYLTDRLTDEAVQFIQANQARPFFLYLTHYAVHTPIQAKAELTQKYQTKPASANHKNAKYAAMIHSVDESVGRVLRTLEQLELRGRTLVIFSSDNGGFGGATSNAPLRGAKGMLYEGGIRVPLLIQWPGVTQAGTRCDEPTLGIDLYPTLLEITETPKPAHVSLDGLSLVPLLKDATAKLGRDAVYWHFPCYLQGSGDPHGGPFRTTPAGAVRMGDWKLIEWFETGRQELYNLKSDLSETKNLVEQEPKIAAQLYERMLAWRKAVAAPVPNQPNPRYDPDAPRGKRKRKQ